MLGKGADHIRNWGWYGGLGPLDRLDAFVCPRVFWQGSSSVGLTIVWWNIGTMTEEMIMNMDEIVENRFTAI